MQLRAYQAEQIKLLRQGIREKHLIQMLMSPTGSGKTEVAKAIISSAYARDNRTYFVVDSLKLISQSVRRLSEEMSIGVVQGNHVLTDYTQNLQIISVQTLRTRIELLLEKYPPKLVVIDEAHVIFEAHLALIEWCIKNNVPVIGLSATPFRKGLGKIFTRLVSNITIQQLTDAGFLVPAVCYAPFSPTTKGVRTAANGDWVEDELGRIMGDAKIVGDVVEHWKELGEGRQTMVFACNVKHARQLAEAFFNAGVMAAHIDGYMDPEESDEILRLYSEGKITVLVSVSMLAKGYDDPATSCLVIARPTKSLMLHYQMLGRGLRICPETGKVDCIIIDHSGNLLLNGKPTDPMPDTLDMGDGDNPDRAKEKSESDPKEHACQQCSYLHIGSLCPKCGYKLEVAEGITTAKGKLVKLEDRKTAISGDHKREVYEQLLGHAQDHGKKAGWAFYAYSAFMGEAPPKEWQMNPRSQPPCEEISRWVKGYNVRRAKRYEKNARTG